MDNPITDHTYQADTKLLYIIIDLAQKLKRTCYLCDFVLLAYTYILYNIYVNDLNYFAYAEVPVILILGFFQYRLVAPRGNFVTKIIIDVRITANHIDLKTAAFKGPLWFKKDPEEICLTKAEFTLTETPGPFLNIFKTNAPVLKLTYGDKELYLMPQYFNWRMEEELKAL